MEEVGLLGKLGIDWKLFLSQAFNFFVLLGVLTFFVYKPLMTVIKERNKKIKTGLENWMPIEDMASFYFHGTRIYVKIDFAYRKGKRLVIVDWKTGKTEDVDMGIQLGCYALYASEKWKVATSNITALVYNLFAQKLQKTEMIDARINETEFRISTSMDAMKKKLVDENAEENLPLPEEQFPRTSNQRSCRYCNFQKVCMAVD